MTDMMSQMKLKIGVMGSAAGKLQKNNLDKAFRLGQSISQNNCILVSGACPGLPLEAARGAHLSGGLTIGISPALSLDEHVVYYKSPTAYNHVLIFTGSGLMGREIINIRSSDIVVIVGGRSGTLGEFAIAYDEGKLIGVLEGTGGIADKMPLIVNAINKDTGAKVMYEKEPEKLIENLIHEYRTSHYKKPSVFADKQFRSLIE